MIIMDMLCRQMNHLRFQIDKSFKMSNLNASLLIIAFLKYISCTIMFNRKEIIHLISSVKKKLLSNL